MDHYTDTCQGNYDFYSDLFSQGRNLAGQAVHTTGICIVITGVAFIVSTVASVAIMGFEKTSSNFNRYAIQPLTRRFPKFDRCLIAIAVKCTSIAAGCILFTPNKAYKATLKDFKKAEDSYENSLNQLNIDLENAGNRNASFDEMLKIFNLRKDQIKIDCQGAIDCARKGMVACKNYIYRHDRFLPYHYTFPQRKSVYNSFNDYRGFLGTRANNLRSIFNSTGAVEIGEFIDHLHNWNPKSSEPVARSNRIIVNQDILNTYPKTYLAKFLNPGLTHNQFSFIIKDNPALDQGGVTREVLTKLFSLLFEQKDGSNRSVLNFGEYLYPYKGLGVALSQVARNPTLFLKDYFDRDLFNIIETLSVDELALLKRGDDSRSVELIKQRVIMALNSGSSTEQISSIFKFKNLEVKTDEDFEEIEELLVDVLDYDEEDLEDLRTTNPEKYKAVIEKEIDTWFKDNQHFYRQADKLIAIAMYFNKAGSLDNIVAPLDREVLARAIIEGDSVTSLDTEPKACIRKKIELIHDWIRTETTIEQLHQFIQFCTGASVLTEQNLIEIYDGTHPFFAHTCFNRLDLSTTFEQRDDPENTTEEQVYAAFKRDLGRVIEPSAGADFNAI